MSVENGWNGWAEAWQADADGSTSDVAAIERRVRREQAGQTLRAWSDIAASMMALGVSGWAIMDGRPAGVVLGLAGIAFSLFSLAVVLGRRRAPSALASRTVAAALAWEIATARSGVRTSVGGMAMAVGALLFLVLCTAVFSHEGVFERDPMAGGWLTLAGLFGASSGLASMWFYRRRKARVKRLERMLEELLEEPASSRG